MVVFTADHGELLGEHGLWYKMSFLDPSARVPLIVRAPGCRAGGGWRSCVSHLDLAPTLADLAGAEIDADELQGASLVPLLRAAGEAPGEAVAEYLAEGVSAPAVMIRRGRHKYVRCGDDPDQLFDLEADPHEVRNLAGDRRGRRSRRLVPATSPTSAGTSPISSGGCSRASAAAATWARALAVGAHFPWDYQPRIDATRQYVRGGAAARHRPGRTAARRRAPRRGSTPPE